MGVDASKRINANKRVDASMTVGAVESIDMNQRQSERTGQCDREDGH